MDARASVWVVAAGVLAGQLAEPMAPATLVLVGLGVGVGGVGLLARRTPAVAWPCLAMLIMALGAVQARSVREPALPPPDIGALALPRRAVLVGRVAETPSRRGDHAIVILEAESVDDHTAAGRVRLKVQGAERPLEYGARIRVATTLRRPRNFENPGRFDYVAYLARRGIRATGFVREEVAMTVLPAAHGGARDAVERWRARLEAAMDTVAGPTESAILRAVVVGEQGGVPPDVREAFTRAGVVHVLSVSGLHVALVAAGAYAIVRWTLGRSTRLLLAFDVGALGRLATLVPVGMYAMLAGAEVPTMRSALMTALAALGAVAGRRVDGLRLLALIATALAVVWPGTPCEIGFQLSFASVFAVILAGRATPPGAASRWVGRGRLALRVSAAATLATAPLTAFHFHQVSLVGVVANLIVIPLFGSVVVGLGLLGAAAEPFWDAAARCLFRVAGALVGPGVAAVQALARPAWAAVDVPVPDVLELALCYAVLAGAVLRRRRWGRVVLLGASLALAADGARWWWARTAPGMTRITFLDVGQGDAAVVELAEGAVLVVDGGGIVGSDVDLGAMVVRPFLLTRKILAVDAVVMTHPHPDHFLGLATVVRRHRPREFWWGGVAGRGPEWDDLWSAVQESRAMVRRIDTDVALPPFARGVRVLHPPPAWPSPSVNDGSVTLRIDTDAGAALLTGDIERAAEDDILGRAERLRAGVLKVPHHGSRTSSQPAFLRAVGPDLAVISVGADNRYGLPSPEVVARYRAAGVRLLRTDRCGAITVRFGRSGRAVETFRSGTECEPGPTRPR